MIVGLVGATGSVGEEVLAALAERRFSADALRLFASEDSEGLHVDYLDGELRVEAAEPDALARCDVLVCAAPLGAAWLEALPEGVALLDLSGALEARPDVPLVSGAAPAADRAAAPRGIGAGIARVLGALASEAPLGRVTITTLEGAGGAGRRGLDALSEQTVQVLNAMDGESDAGGVFPRSLAFDVLPGLGDDDEARLGEVLRRLLAAPGLELEITRVRVPVFLGSLAVLNVALEKQLPVERARERLAADPGIEIVELPTPRGAVGADAVHVGRLRATAAGLSLVLAQDDLRQAARAALAFIESRG